MEIRDYAFRILTNPDLAIKLERIGPLITDDAPGDVLRLETPVRPPNLEFAPRRSTPAMPPPGSLHVPRKRAIAHHIMANHELQALEIMAWTLLAFPNAPAGFRRGMVDIMTDEQRHTRMHADRCAALGIPFGTLPVNGYFWLKAQQFQTELEYLAGLPLVFEGGNLDHSLEFEQIFQQVGDSQSAGIMRAIHRDEIEHVRFGIEWLRQLKPQEVSDWDAFVSHLHWPLRAGKARGKSFSPEARRAAGLDEDFIARLALESPLPTALPPGSNSPGPKTGYDDRAE